MDFFITVIADPSFGIIGRKVRIIKWKAARLARFKNHFIFYAPFFDTPPTLIPDCTGFPRLEIIFILEMFILLPKKKKKYFHSTFVIRSKSFETLDGSFFAHVAGFKSSCIVANRKSTEHGRSRFSRVTKLGWGYVASSQVPQRSKNFHPHPNNRIFRDSTMEFCNYRRKNERKESFRYLLATNFPQFPTFSYVDSYLHLVNAKIPRQLRIARSAGQRTRFRGKPFE